MIRSGKIKLEYNFVNERIVIKRLKFDKGHLTVTGTYAPEDKLQIYNEELQRTLSKLNKTDCIVVAGDINARIGKDPYVTGIHGEHTLINNGK